MNRHASRLLAMARRWLGVDARDRMLDAELESFLQHEMDARIVEGMTPGEARRTALASTGGIQQVKERAGTRGRAPGSTRSGATPDTLLLAGTGAAVRVLIGLYRTSLGYDPHNVMIALINLPENRRHRMGRPRRVL